MIYSEGSCGAIDKKDIKATPLENKFVASGWPAASDDYADRQMNLHEFLISQPSATYFMRIGSDQYAHEGICKNDLLIVDRSIMPVAGRLVIAVVEGTLTVHRVVRINGHLFFSGPKPIPIGSPNTTDASVWGVIAHIVRTL